MSGTEKATGRTYLEGAWRKIEALQADLSVMRASVDDLFRERASLLSERDALRAALEDLSSLLTADGDEWAGTDVAPEFATLAGIARAALSGGKGGAA